jgi:hypothetical protein
MTTTIAKFQQFMGFTKQLTNFLVINEFKVDYILDDLNMRVVTKKENYFSFVCFVEYH